MLEWSVQCSACKAWFGGVALPPFVWWTRIMGATCRQCGAHYDPPELLKLENSKRHGV